MTPTSGEKETNKNKKLILAGIGLAVLIIIVIVIAVACSGKKNKPTNLDTNNTNDESSNKPDDQANNNPSDESPDKPDNKPFNESTNNPSDESPDKPGDEPSIEPNKEITIDISHKLNEVLKYSEETTQTTSVNFNGDDSRLRSLAERKQSTTIKGNYLLNVYKVDDNVSPKLYYAYAILNKLTKQISGKTNEDNLGGEDITLLNEGTNKLPLIKFNFDENGEISNLEIPKELSVTLASYIYEFIQKVIHNKGEDDKENLL